MRWPSPRRIGAVVGVETAQLIHDRPSLSLLLLLPIVQILLYGYAIDLTPRHIPIAVSASDARLVGPMTRAIDENPALTRIGAAGPPGSAERAVREGRALVGIELGHSDENGAPKATIYADAADPATVRPVTALLQSALWQRAAELYAGENSPSLETIWLNNPARDAQGAMAPGLIGVVVMISMLFLGAMTLARERERGSWEALLATPVTPADALIGKLTPYLVIGLVETLIMLTLVRLLFGTPLPPGAIWLVLAALPLAVAYLILGFAFSALASTQMQAVQGAVAFYLPSLLLSGFMFPFSGMPRWAQVVGEIMPLTHYIRATRDVLMRGQGLECVCWHMAPVCLFAAVAFGVALLAYRQRLD